MGEIRQEALRGGHELMSGDSSSSIRFRFVPVGTTAPDPLPPNEVWLDVGSRVGPRVLDHHGGDASVWSATELVLERGPELLADIVSIENRLALVTHQRPDLDAVASTWLVSRYLFEGHEILEEVGVQQIVAAVSSNDQGIFRDKSPEESWAIVARTLISTMEDFSDRDILVRMHEFMDKTLAILNAGSGLADAARRLPPPSVQAVIAHARRQYLEDLSRARFFQVRLPVSLIGDRLRVVDNRPPSIPAQESTAWSLADGLYLDNPTSALFKEMARTDTVSSPTKTGFPLLVVSRPQSASDGTRLWRHIISADPMAGLNLEGLGPLLEEVEKSIEDQCGEPLRSGRERLEAGAGRHGYDIAAPWYDGRGHNFTIVDSPGYVDNGRHMCASVMDPEAVLDVLWRYGDPGRFMTVLEAEISLMCPVHLMPGWHEHWGQGEPLGSDSPLIEEYVESGRFSEIHRAPLGTEEAHFGLVPVERRLIPFSSEAAVFVLVFQCDKMAHDLRALAGSLFEIRLRHPGQWTGPGLNTTAAGWWFHTVWCRIPSAEIAVGDETGFSGQALARLALAGGVCFADRLDDDELSAVRRKYTRDRRTVVVTTESGVVVASERERRMALHEPFLQPGQISLLAALAVAQRFATREMALDFSRHRHSSDPRFAERLILEDRERLLELEQDLTFRQVAKEPLAQKVFDDLTDALRVRQLVDQTRLKIESLTAQVRERRAQFYQRVGFWLSFLFAPLVLTAGLFSGIHMDRNFSEKYLTPYPVDLQPAGWILFATIFGAFSFALGALWITNRLVGRRNSRRRRPRRAGAGS